MLVKKIIPCLDLKNGKVVKGQQFLNVQEVDDPLTRAKIYDAAGADEIVLYDITASMDGRQFFGQLVQEVKAAISVPLVVGGGVNTLADFERLFALGADKISINSGVIKNPNIIKEASDAFGSEKVILSMDVQSVDGTYRLFAKGGMENTGIDALDWAKQGEQNGAGALVLNSIATDGVREGFDLPMLKAFSSAVDTPIIASGGAGSYEDFLTLFNEIPTMYAGLGASVFHFDLLDIATLKQYLQENGIAVQPKENAK